MQFGNKIVSSQQKFVNNFIHFKLINLIKKQQLSYNKMSEINEILLNGDMHTNIQSQ